MGTVRAAPPPPPPRINALLQGESWAPLAGAGMSDPKEAARVRAARGGERGHQWLQRRWHSHSSSSPAAAVSKNEY